MERAIKLKAESRVNFYFQRLKKLRNDWLVISCYASCDQIRLGNIEKKRRKKYRASKMSSWAQGGAGGAAPGRNADVRRWWRHDESVPPADGEAGGGGGAVEGESVAHTFACGRDGACLGEKKRISVSRSFHGQSRIVAGARARVDRRHFLVRPPMRRPFPPAAATRITTLTPWGLDPAVLVCSTPPPPRPLREE